MLLNQLSEKSKHTFLKLETFLANVDGKFDKSEEKIIKAHCNEMGLEPIPYDVSIPLEEIVEGVNTEVTVREKKIILIELLTVAIVDGIYDDTEKEFVAALRKLLQIPEEVVQQAYEMVKKLTDISISIENFVEW